MLTSPGVEMPALPFANRTIDVDRQILIEVTKRCHCACAHCFTDAGPHVRTAEPTRNQVGTLVATARHLGLTSVTFSGGELMLRQDIDALVQAVEPGADLWLFTSGLRLGFDALLRWAARVAGYVVSLDGTAARHDWLRRRSGSFDENVAFLKRLAAAGCRVQIQSMVLGVDDEHLEPVIRLAEAVHAERILFSHVSPDGRGLSLADFHLGPEQLDALHARVKALQQDTPVRLRTNLMPKTIVEQRFPRMALHVVPTGEVLPWFGAPRAFAVAHLDAHGWDLARAIGRTRLSDTVTAAFDRARSAALGYAGDAVPVDDLIVRELRELAACN